MGCCFGGPKAPEVTCFAYGQRCRAVPYKPFGNDLKIQKPEPHSVPSPAAPVQAHELIKHDLPLFDLSQDYEDAYTVVVEGDMKWTPAAAKWLNANLRVDCASLFCGRERVLYAGLSTTGTSACIVLSNGWLLELQKKRKVPNWLRAFNVVNMTQVTLEADNSLTISGEALKGAPEALPRQRENELGPIEMGPKSEIMTFVQSAAQTKRLVSVLRTLAYLLRCTALKIDTSKQPGFTEDLFPAPGPPCDKGFCNVFYAICSSLNVPPLQIAVGTQILIGLPMMELDVSGITPSGPAVSYAIAEAFIRVGGFPGLIRRSSKFQGLPDFSQFARVCTWPALLKLDLTDCELSGEMVAALAEKMTQGGGSGIVDLSLSGNPGVSASAAKFAEALERTKDGVRRLSLARCGLTGQNATPLLRLFGTKVMVKLEHLDLSGNALGALGSPHPLTPLIEKAAKLESLNLADTRLDVFQLLDGVKEGTQSKALKYLDLSRTDLGTAQNGKLSPPVDRFLASLGASLTTVRAEGCFQEPADVAAFLEALGRTPSPELSIDLGGVMTNAMRSPVEAIGLAGSRGPLPGERLILDAACFCSSTPGAQLLTETERFVANYFAQQAANPNSNPGQARGAGELQKEAAEQVLAMMNPLVGPVVSQLQTAGAACAGTGKLKKLRIKNVQSQSSMSMCVQLANEILGPLQVSVPTVGVGPPLAYMISSMAESKDLTELDLSGSTGGDALGVVLGAQFLRTNRSVKSLRVDGNYFSNLGLAAIRGAFYGNTKVVDFPFPALDAQARLKKYQELITSYEQQVLNCRGKIKRAFKSTKGARTPYVVNTLNSEVENIKGFKQKTARLRALMAKYAKIQTEIQEAVARNQKDPKNVAQTNKVYAAAWKQADKAIEKANALQQTRDEEFKKKAQGMQAERKAVLTMWFEKITKMKKSHKDVAWFDEWKQMAAAEKPPEGGADNAVPQPTLTHETADMLLEMVPEDQVGSYSAEMKRTQALITTERDVFAQREISNAKVDEQKLVAAKLLSSPGMPAVPASYTNLTNAKVTSSGTVAKPPVALLASNQPQSSGNQVQSTSAKAQASKYEQLKVYQAQQEQKREAFMQKVAPDLPPSSGSPPGTYVAAGAAAGVAAGFGGAYMYSHSQWGPEYSCRPCEEWLCSRTSVDYYNGGGWFSKKSGWYCYVHHPNSGYHQYHDDYYYYHGGSYHYGYYHHHGHYYDPYYHDHMYVDNDREYYDDGMMGEDMGTIDAGEFEAAGEAVDMYAGGEEDRPGGGPPFADSKAVRALLGARNWLNPTPPKLDVAEWFETEMRKAERNAQESVLGREGPLPCDREILLQTSSKSQKICLVTQCSIDRLPKLRAQLEAWDGEVSVAIFVDASRETLAAAEARRDIIKMCAHAASTHAERRGTDAQLAWTVAVVHKLPEEEQRCPEYDRLYPVNTLRNEALRNARADMVFLLDVDFVPSRQLYSRLTNEEDTAACKRLDATLRSAGPSGNPVALVIPAFEVKHTLGALPRDSEALRNALDKGDAEGFHIQQFPKGHRATDFKRWLAGPDGTRSARDLHLEAHAVDAYGVDYEEHFEPYVVVARELVPAYDERFRGYGLNKISHLYDMASRGFSFCVIDGQDAFVAAVEHPRSASWKLMYSPEADATHRARLAVHYAQFKKAVQARATPPRRVIAEPPSSSAASRAVCSTFSAKTTGKRHGDMAVTASDIARQLEKLLSDFALIECTKNSIRVVAIPA
eukprot:TRINITY_DN10452_c0_g1_i1.p1 TRINITY_DN10452_c0_g1~~TRINITY_DN10452_c0_g1_i1.p1  ORF type:complete len:1741 (+),score=335.54 TRINITY_DN10452_c0_g1_i1:88-5310(+)